MHFTTFLLCLITLGTLVPQSAAPAADQDLKKMQGEWTAKIQAGGVEKKATMTVQGKEIRFDGPDGKEWYEGILEIDSKAKPKRISVRIKDCPIEQFKKQTVEGIYRLDEKTWTITATAPGAPEGPSGFDDPKARSFEFSRTK